MDSLTSAIQGIAPALGIGTAGAGIAGNLMNAITRGQQVSQLQSAEKKLANLTPEQLSGMVAKGTAPLNQNLLQNVGNLVQADVAGRGLAESPGVFAATESQALAPYQQQNQSTALQLVMKKLGLPIEYADAIINAVGPNANVGSILQTLMQMPQKSNLGGVPDTSGIPSPVPGILDQIIQSGLTSGGDFGGGTTGSFGGLE
jgi:hypothetical protein